MPILNAATFFFLCVCISTCVFLCNRFRIGIQLLRGWPAAHVSPEGEETRHHIGGKEKRQTEGRNGEKHN